MANRDKAATVTVREDGTRQGRTDEISTFNDRHHDRRSAGRDSSRSSARFRWWPAANANSDYVSAELGYTGASYGMLRARATTIGPWEKFDFCYDATQGWWAISSDANGLYVTAQFGYAGASFGELTASSSIIGPYQKWVLGCVPGSPVGPQIEFVTIQAQTNLNYVSTEIGYTGASYAMLRARAATAGPWEKYFNPSGFLCG